MNANGLCCCTIGRIYYFCWGILTYFLSLAVLDKDLNVMGRVCVLILRLSHFVTYDSHERKSRISWNFKYGHFWDGYLDLMFHIENVITPQWLLLILTRENCDGL